MERENQSGLESVLRGIAKTVDRALGGESRGLVSREVGRVVKVGPGVATVEGLPGAQSEELIRFAGNRFGMAFNLDADEIGVVLLDDSEGIQAGAEVHRTGRVMDVPVGEALLGRVVDATGRPLDDGGPIPTDQRQPIEREAPAVLDRAAVDVPLQTGIKVVDALIPIGRGQRELILGDRQSGKTAIAVDAIVNQKSFDVICFYCAIGQGGSATAKTIAELRRHGAMEYTTAVVASGEDPAGLRFVAPYAATSMAEFFTEQGRDVLIVYDDLTRHAVAYRELSLLLRRPPGREAFPGDIFYIHSRLLERATHLRDELKGGSLTALPIVETEAQNISSYIPTNLISITDGQIYLSPVLFQRGQLPAVDVGRSVSRVGGKAQLPAFSEITGDLKLAYAQFEELERFSRYGAHLEDKQRRALEHGRRVREVLKQPQYQPRSAAEQIAVLFAASDGLLDELPLEAIGQAEEAIRARLAEQLTDVVDRIQSGQQLGDEDRRKLREMAKQATDSIAAGRRDGDAGTAQKQD